MPRSDDDWADDILHAIADIRDDTGSMDFPSFAANRSAVRSVLDSIGVIGEAAKHCSDAFKSRHPGVPWRAIAGSRDRIVHEYFRTAVNRVWDVVTDDLDPLEASLRRSLPDANGDPPPRQHARGIRRSQAHC